MANPALISLLGNVLGAVIKKTVNKEKIKENAAQTSTKVAGVLAAIAAAPSVAEVAETGAVIPASEGELIFQAIMAIGAVIAYYIDLGKKTK